MTMPNLTGIRTALATALRAGGTGITSILTATPEKAPVALSAWLGDADSEVVMGASEMWTHHVPLTVAVNRRGMIADELAATEAKIDDVMTVIRANYTLGGLCNGVSVVRVRQGPIAFNADVMMFGFTMELSIREKDGTTITA